MGKISNVNEDCVYDCGGRDNFYSEQIGGNWCAEFAPRCESGKGSLDPQCITNGQKLFAVPLMKR